jgi:succinate dehydrogenase / fumarate reductase cytochrome b subunit
VAGIARRRRGAGYFDFVNGFYGSWFGRLILFGFTWALVHHMLGGLRHFIWDMGAGFDREAIEVACQGDASSVPWR